MSEASASHSDPLGGFEPGLRAWFRETFQTPTEVQRLAWPAIAAGEHVLATAPTGSGKTLTAFFWALNRFAAGSWQPGATRVLYVSPLKALNNDIRRNLLTPLEALRARGSMPEIRVQTRSGDTPQNERQRMLRRPPEILVTTPESLLLLLTSSRGRHALASIETVITDEVHGLVDNRRGTVLLAALERLAHLAGEFQRVALSATVRPLADVARYVAGQDASGRPRPMRVLDPGTRKDIEFSVRLPEAVQREADAGNGEDFWRPLGAAFREIIAGNRATLFFVNSRRLAERLTAAINESQGTPLAYAHHGSLSREIRLEVEQRLKSGALRAIVATSSLEMGIDIGALDEVVLIQAPPSVAAALQRIGRAGHRVGEVSRASLYPTFAQDFVDAAALTAAVADRDIEPLQPLRGPLDVLCQLLVAFTASETWPVDELYQLLCRSGPYADLPRARFDLVVEMLAGRYAGARVRELRPRLSYDRIRGTLRAQRGAVLALYSSGGVIPDRGYYQIRHDQSGAVIGELDEEFVWEARVGQVFSLGTQNWRIHRITHNDVMVRPSRSRGSAPPFWRAEDQGRGFHYSARIAGFLARADTLLDEGGRPALIAELKQRGFDATAAAELADYLARQREATEAALPHHGHLLVERILSAPGGYRSDDDSEQLVLHTFWGGRVNRPWALAVGAALREQGVAVDLHVDDNAVALQTREPLDADAVLAHVSSGNLLSLLRRSLEASGFFGARFREAAGRSLLLPRQRFDARLPLWLSRRQAKKLLSEVARFEDFPVLLEAWRTCLEDEFDLPALTAVLNDLADGRVRISRRTRATPSPFAAHLSFQQIQPYMYASDQPDGQPLSALADDLIVSAVNDAALRPRLAAETVALFEARRQRRAEGYTPADAADWADWIKERVLLPGDEAPADFEIPDVVVLEADDGRRWLAHLESLAALVGSGLLDGVSRPAVIPDLPDPRDAQQLGREILSFHGPLSAAALHRLMPRVPAGLLEQPGLVRGPLLADDDAEYVCDADNLESLLRLQRSLQRPALAVQPATRLPAFVAAWQGLGAHDPARSADLEDALAALRGYEAPVPVWLHDLPAARLPGGAAELLDPALDRTFAELGLAWLGTGPGRVRIGYPEDLELLREADSSGAGPASEPDAASAWFADPAARYGYGQIADAQGRSQTDFNEHWWQAVWRGALSADSLMPLRQGEARDYRLGQPVAGGSTRSDRNGRRRGPRLRRAAAAAWAGTWYLTPPSPAPADPLEALEETKEIARLLLDRYGLVCRELANREGGRSRWARLFRALRVMELSGEVLAGYFFAGLSGPQFLTPAALPLLERPDHAPTRTFWCNALDPVSPCGLGLDWPALPQRRPQNYLVFHRHELALVVENLGRRLTFHLEPDDPACRDATAVLTHLLGRQRRLAVESVNGEPLRNSAYRAVIAGAGRIVSDHRTSFLESNLLS